MKFKQKICYFFAFIAFFAMAIPQGMSQITTDLTQLRIDDLSDDQIKELVNRASEAGLNTAEFLQMAQARGMQATEIVKLRNRIEELEMNENSIAKGSKSSKRSPRQQTDFNTITQGFYQPQLELGDFKSGSEIFGTSLFYQKERKLSFEPSLNQATPKSYILGPGDVVYVDIYGQSEQYYEASVNPDGFILLDNIGPISVSGKSIDEATGIIKNRVSRYYPGISGSNPSTFIQVTLGNVRTIKVHILGEVRLPGTFTLSAFSTVFNALYAAGGPNENGSMRAIRLIRNNKLIAEIDVYQLLIKGTAQLDKQLQDQDVRNGGAHGSRVVDSPCTCAFHDFFVMLQCGVLHLSMCLHGYLLGLNFFNASLCCKTSSGHLQITTGLFFGKQQLVLLIRLCLKVVQQFWQERQQQAAKSRDQRQHGQHLSKKSNVPGVPDDDTDKCTNTTKQHYD
jgi:protein involved in polysaccharide export with SLBB domain